MDPPRPARPQTPGGDVRCLWSDVSVEVHGRWLGKSRYILTSTVGLSNVRRRVEQLATQAGSGGCNGYHRVQRIVHVHGDDPTPPWPEEDSGKRCACGAELELCSIVHQHIPHRPELPVVVH